jgi:hypothetical protein
MPPVKPIISIYRFLLKIGVDWLRFDVVQQFLVFFYYGDVATNNYAGSSRDDKPSFWQKKTWDR